MAIYPSILAWEIPWPEEPGGLQSMGYQRVRHDLATTTKHLEKNTKNKNLLVNTSREFQQGEEKEKETGNKKMRESIRTKKTAQRK